MKNMPQEWITIHKHTQQALKYIQRTQQNLLKYLENHHINNLYDLHQHYVPIKQYHELQRKYQRVKISNSTKPDHDASDNEAIIGKATIQNAQAANRLNKNN